jgi:16S rRNA (guanine527-N7)-methyltransferase
MILMMDSSAFVDQARAFGVELGPAQWSAFETYYRELVAWNARVNLTAINGWDEVAVKHFMDSLSVALALHAHPPRNLIDIGSGAGFPGLPLKIAFPAVHVTLLEATGKKVEFLRHLIATLELNDVAALHARAENLAHEVDHRDKYDVAVARAVANLATLVEYALPFVRLGGLFVAQKGMQVEDEVRRAEQATSALGGRVRHVLPVELPGLEPRHLIVIEKTAPTPPKYPRRAGVPEKKPIL